MWISHQITISDASQGHIISALVQDLDINGIETGDGYCKLYYEDEKLSDTIRLRCASITAPHHHHVELIPDENWNKKWESNYDPVAIDSFCLVYAPFHEISTTDYEHAIVIQPQMSFGTGHHETTRMMIQQMRPMAFRDSHVVDFGAGTGVLAILASMMGAKEVTAIEYDGIAVENMIENGQRNGCTEVAWIHGDHLRDLPSKSADIVLANILRSVILDHLEDILSVVREDGRIVFSGYKDNEREHIEAACSAHGWTIVTTLIEDGWCCQSFKKE